jgi:predicted GIY-YIG superfamily endonuclease
MSYIYLLQSPDGTDIYIRFSNDLKRRFSEHERSAHPGWRLVITKLTDRKATRRRERRLKDHGNAVEQLKQRIKARWVSNHPEFGRRNGAGSQ